MNEHHKKIAHDVVSGADSETGWLYSDIVKEHFLNPHNMMMEHEEKFNADGKGVVGSPACGDMMVVWIKVNKNSPAGETRIAACKWRTFGCASAIASTSMMSIMATENGGMTLDEAKNIKPAAIIERLGGLPDRKVHCSVLGHQALKAAVEDYLAKPKKTHLQK